MDLLVVARRNKADFDTNLSCLNYATLFILLPCATIILADIAGSTASAAAKVGQISALAIGSTLLTISVSRGARAARDAAVREWERAYILAYLRLAETSIGILILDDALWAKAFAEARHHTVLQLGSPRLPRGPLELVQLSAQLWPSLCRYQCGDREALAAGIAAVHPFLRLGPMPRERWLGLDLTTQALFAAITDFLFAPPSRLPPERDPHLSQYPVRRKLELYGYDYRLRAPGDRDME